MMSRSRLAIVIDIEISNFGLANVEMVAKNHIIDLLPRQQQVERNHTIDGPPCTYIVAEEEHSWLLTV